MSYTASAALLSDGRATAAQIQEWFIARGPGFAPEYAPDGQYKPPPDGLGQTIIDECRRYADAGVVVNWDLCSAQILTETAAWQSKYARERNNPGGIGAVNLNPDLAIRFPDMAAGLRAHVAHLLDYAVGFGPWSASDVRVGAITDAGWLGVCHTLADLNGRWAWPGTTYGQSIAELANQLLATEVPTMPTVSITGFHPPVIVRQPFKVNGVSYMGEAMEMHGVCIHETGNTNAGAEAQQNVNYMNSQECISRQASWHATVGLDQIIETIPDDRQAFHASDGDGPGNTHFYAIEGVVCYKVGTPEFTRVLQNHAWYAARKLRDKGLPWRFTGDAGGTVAQHNTFARDHKDCPQQYRDAGLWNTFLAYGEAFYASMGDGAQPADGPHGDDAITVMGHKIKAGFRGLWEAVPEGARLYVYGEPEDEEQEVPAGHDLLVKHGIASYQRFHRCGWMVYQPKENPSVTVAAHELWKVLEAA